MTLLQQGDRPGTTRQPATGYRVRPATVADAAVLAYHRRRMFEDMGVLDPAGSPALEQASRRYVEQAIPAGAYYGWIVDALPAEAAGAGPLVGVPVAGGGLQLRPLLPRPGHLEGGVEALLLSVWTDPAHRRRGLATLVLEAMLGWCRARGIRRVVLHASDEGRPLYERYGFRPSNEMLLDQGRG